MKKVILYFILGLAMVALPGCSKEPVTSDVAPPPTRSLLQQEEDAAFVELFAEIDALNAK